MNTDTDIFLEKQYKSAMGQVSGKDAILSNIPKALESSLNTILAHSEDAKAVYTVVLTSVVYKILHPEQDIRRHQVSIPCGYGGRPFDTKYITPFLKRHNFPAMAESGWLTRSLEQKVPYDKFYTGAIRPDSLKQAFLNVIDEIENGNNGLNILTYLLQGLIIQRDKHIINIAKPQNLSINEIVKLLSKHFNKRYASRGASRLPVLAIYALYQLLMPQIKRYAGKQLLPLANHTSADAQSGRLGDIDIVNEDGSAYEAVEIKFGIPVSHEIVMTAKIKIHPTKVCRYYVLSTEPILESDSEKIEKDILQIKNVHGCQLIVNGIMPTIKYYLRLVDNTALFIDHYAELLSSDEDIKFEHKQAWNDLISL